MSADQRAGYQFKYCWWWYNTAIVKSFLWCGASDVCGKLRMVKKNKIDNRKSVAYDNEPPSHSKSIALTLLEIRCGFQSVSRQTLSGILCEKRSCYEKVVFVYTLFLYEEAQEYFSNIIEKHEVLWYISKGKVVQCWMNNFVNWNISIF